MQTEVLKLQTALNKHEQLKYKNSIRPHFVIHFKNEYGLKAGWYNRPFHIELLAKTTNGHIAQNISIQTIYDEKDKNWDLTKPTHIKYILSFEPIHSIAFDYYYNGKFDLTKYSFRRPPLFIFMNFEDVSGNNYSQMFSLYPSGKKLLINEGQPFENSNKSY